MYGNGESVALSVAWLESGSHAARDRPGMFSDVPERNLDTYWDNPQPELRAPVPSSLDLREPGYGSEARRSR